MRETMNKLTHGATRLLVLALGLGLVSRAWADPITADNPVTGETETYAYKYVGTSGTWVASDWQNADGSPAANPPNTENSAIWDPLLIDGNKTVAADTIEGYTLNLGLFNGAKLTIGTLSKWQGGCSVKVGSGSKLTISALGGKTFDNAINFYVAAQSGIEYACNYGKNGSFYYHFADSGSVVYQQLTGGSHTIKAADVTLEQPAEKALKHKTLVTFSNQPTFSIDAAIKIKNSAGTVMQVAFLNSIVDTTPTITTADSAGTCQFVRTATGIDLYWIDGAFDASPYAESISINFAHGANNIEDSFVPAYGVGSYAVRAAFWNTMVSAGGAFATPLSSVYKLSSVGQKEKVSGLSVAVSDTRGSWASSGGNILNGYIDDSNVGTQNPVVTVSGIPSEFSNYRVVMYFSNDTNGRQFGYVTINDKNYWGTDAWGSANYAAFTENGNYRVSPIVAHGDGTLTITTHNMQTSVRAGLAAIQIFKVDTGYIANDDGNGALEWNVTPPTSGSSDGIVDLAGDATLTVDSAASFGKLSLTGFGTLTLAGSAKISAATIDVGKNVILNVNADRLDATTYTGSGTVVYTGAKPTSGKGWTNADNWTGTVWVKDITAGTQRENWDLNLYGHSGSVLRFTNVKLWFKSGTSSFTVPVDIEGDGLNICDAHGSAKATLAKITGTGTFTCDKEASSGNCVTITDGSEFRGAVTFSKQRLVFGSNTELGKSGTVVVETGNAVTVASGKTWGLSGSVTVNGEMNVSGFIWASGGITVNGLLAASKYKTSGDGATFGGGTAITVAETGTFRIENESGNPDETTLDYSKIDGTGTIEFSGAGYRCLPSSNFPTSLILKNEQASGLLLKNGGATYTVGSISGSKNFRADWTSGSAARTLKVLQAKDTTWSGLIHTDGESRLGTLEVAPGVSASGTLTLSGAQTQTAALVVDADAKVKVTGTWKGATSVSGSLALGGTGKIDGAVTTAAGSVLDYADATGASHITGALTLDADTTIKFPAGTTFPYKLAGSIAGSVTSLAASKYMIGETAGTVPLLLSSDGNAYISASATFSGTSDWRSPGSKPSSTS